ncbi:MAG: antibiotic biosynthesis monooxygenase [Bacillota bacterium]
MRTLILREWRGRVPAAKGDAYLHFLRGKPSVDYAHTPGHRGTWILEERGPKVVEFVLLTLWESRRHIRAFAGPDISLARYYPEDPDFLLEMPPHVRHYEIKEQPMDTEPRFSWLARWLHKPLPAAAPAPASKPVVRIAGLR